jgi:hypothetical protein
MESRVANAVNGGPATRIDRGLVRVFAWVSHQDLLTALALDDDQRIASSTSS